MVFGLPMGKSAKVAVSIAAIESITKILLFYFHERVWARVKWGRATPSSWGGGVAPEGGATKRRCVPDSARSQR